MNKTQIAAIIPARWGSTRFPGKPLHLLAGKPLLQHVWERCLRARQISQVVIATDDMRIAEAAFDFGADVALTSPRHQSGTDRIAEVASKMSGITHVLNVQGDEPMVEPALLNRIARTLAADPDLGMVTAASPFETAEEVGNPNMVKVVLNRSRDALYFSRSPIPYQRSKIDVTYYRHHGIYGYSSAFLLQFVKWKPTLLEKTEQLEQLRALENGARIRVLLTRSAAVGVDTPEDALRVSELLKKI